MLVYQRVNHVKSPIFPTPPRLDGPTQLALLTAAEQQIEREAKKFHEETGQLWFYPKMVDFNPNKPGLNKVNLTKIQAENEDFSKFDLTKNWKLRI